jgi:RNA polymerase sigma factor (sigma-70 family)
MNFSDRTSGTNMNDLKVLGDSQLALGAQNRESIALAELLRRHYSTVAQAVQRTLQAQPALGDREELLKDIAQEAMLTVLDRLDNFEPQREGTSFAAWAIIVARRATMDAVRFLTAQKRDPGRTGSDWLESLAAEQSSPTQVVRRNEIVELVRKVVAILRPIDREVLTLCDLQEIPISEVASILRILTVAVCMRRARARHNLLRHFKGRPSDYLER